MTDQTGSPRTEAGRAMVEHILSLAVRILGPDDQHLVPGAEQIRREVAAIESEAQSLSGEREGIDGLDGGRIARHGWHYPACWQRWASAWFPDEVDCDCARLASLPTEGGER